MALWMRDTVQVAPFKLIPSTQVVVRKPEGDSHPPKATCVQGISHLMCRLGSARFVLSPRNSDGDDRAASPGWGGTAPSKSLIGRHWLETETTANTLATRSRIGHKQRAITAASLGAWQRLSPDSETRTEMTSYRVGLNPLFNISPVMTQRHERTER